mmetsp:Transcript_38949/g.82277  ORF Transcript_38949/g.82277 Transcript_38949/m.82277 type:complete len:102 (-) Transcript_38949:11-316(-)
MLRPRGLTTRGRRPRGSIEAALASRAPQSTHCKPTIPKQGISSTGVGQGCGDLLLYLSDPGCLFRRPGKVGMRVCREACSSQESVSNIHGVVAECQQRSHR